MTGPACGNNPNHQLTDGDRRAVEDFKAYLAERATLRDRIAAALYAHDHPSHAVPLNETGMEAAYRETADAVLAVLPATTDQTADEADVDTVANRAAQVIGSMGAEIRELRGQRDRNRTAWHSARRRASVLSAEITRRAPLLGEYTAQIEGLRVMYNASEARVNDLIEERDQLLEARADRAAVLREAADEIAGIDFHPNARARSLDIAAGLARRLRRMADETQPAETDAPVLSPAERTMLGYALDQAQERIWAEDGFTEEDQAAVDSLRRLTAEQPAAGARQDGAQ